MAAPGLERLIAGELETLGVRSAEVVDGGVECTMTLPQLYGANLHLRTASRVLRRLARFRAVTFAELERNARRIPWDAVIARGEPLALRVTCRKSKLYHSGAVAERLMRDAAERMEARPAPAPSSDDDATDAQLVVVRLEHNVATISADSSGAHLHQRGYRTAVTPAPVRETLAAALLLASGWDGTAPLIDPFCGSGTIPIEAALLAARIAPGSKRRFRFQLWPDFDAAIWRRALESARQAERAPAVVIRGADRSAAAVRAAQENAARAGVEPMVTFAQADVRNLHPDDTEQPGWIVTNPPYGVRLGDRAEAGDILRRLDTVLASRFAGWRVALLAPDDRAAPGLRARLQESPLRTTNGGIRVRVLLGQA